MPWQGNISAETARRAVLGLNGEELAFYDALAENGSARELTAHEQLRLLAQILVPNHPHLGNDRLGQKGKRSRQNANRGAQTARSLRLSTGPPKGGG